MICGLITAACFYVVPALGTPTKVNLPAIGDLIALRSGELRTINWQSVKGIVAFPSFHVVWAILLMLAMPSYPLVLLNLLVIVSTVTTGGHYLIDLVGGALICAIVVPIINRRLAAFHLNSAERAV
jgi:membrane-associated phospholipid phosphatase